jgi:hypothetical protein
MDHLGRHPDCAGILSLCYVHVSNRYTLSIPFERDVPEHGWLDARRRHVQQIVLAYLCGREVDVRAPSFAGTARA